MFVFLADSKKQDMKEFSVEKFFDPVKRPKIDDDLNEKMKNSMDIVHRMACTLNHSLYVIDYLKQSFVYVSPDKLFLCGYSVEQVLEWGYSFYTRVVPENDLRRLLEINKVGFDFYYKLPIEKRYMYSIEYDFDLVSGRYVVDAKSIMGIFSLDLAKPLDLNIHTEEGVDEVLEFLKPYIMES